MKKYNGVNLFKFIMAIFVIAIHTCPLVDVQNIFIIRLYESIVQLAVPFFLISTGFFTGKKMKNINIYSDNDNKVIRNARNKTVKLYLVYTLIYMPLTIYNYITNGKTILLNILDFIRGLVVTGVHYNSWILWYLLGTFYSLSIIQYLNKKNFTIKKILKVGLAFFIVGYIIDLILMLENVTGIFLIIRKLLQSTLSSGRMFVPLLYISIGMILSKSKVEKYNNYFTYIFSIICLIIMNVITPNFMNKLITLPSIIVVFILSINIKLADSKLFDMLRYCSEKMYFWHLYIWSIMCLIINKGKITEILGLNIFLGCVLISIIFSLLLYVIEGKRKKIIDNKEKITH